MTESYGRHLSFPFRVSKDGRTTQVDTFSEHVRDELIQLILTDPGERLFQPEIGTGVKRLVFENLDPATEGMTKATITQAISRWLGHRLTLEEVKVTIENETIEVEIRYRVVGSDESRVMKFQRNGV